MDALLCVFARHAPRLMRPGICQIVHPGFYYAFCPGLECPGRLYWRAILVLSRPFVLPSYNWVAAVIRGMFRHMIDLFPKVKQCYCQQTQEYWLKTKNPIMRNHILYFPHFFTAGLEKRHISIFKRRVTCMFR